MLEKSESSEKKVKWSSQSQQWLRDRTGEFFFSTCLCHELIKCLQYEPDYTERDTLLMAHMLCVSWLSKSFSAIGRSSLSHTRGQRATAWLKHAMVKCPKWGLQSKCCWHSDRQNRSRGGFNGHPKLHGGGSFSQVLKGGQELEWMRTRDKMPSSRNEHRENNLVGAESCSLLDNCGRQFWVDHKP